MDWLSLPVPVMLGPDFLRLPEAVRATWLSLLAFCACRENGGVISDAEGWSNRDWDRLAGTSKLGINKIVEGGLAWWEGGDLHVNHYPLGPEEKRKQRQESGRVGGQRSGETRKSQGKGRSTGGAELRSSASNGEERRGEEGRGECALASQPPLALTLSEPSTTSPITQLRSAWVAWFRERYAEEYRWSGRDASDATELLALANGRGVDEVMRRARILGAQKREKSITPAIVRLAWNELAGRPQPTTPVVDRLMDGISSGRLR
jgi:hypothetical protein